MASSLLRRPLSPYSRPTAGRVGDGFGAARTLVLGLSRVLFTALSAATVSAAPLSTRDWEHDGTDPHDPPASVWVLYVASVALVLLGGAFAGLTIALMGQDSIYLQVLSRDDTEPQQKNARRVYDLLQRGKHWVLVTLLLSNVIVNETLPVVLDRCLGGGVAAVVGSTLLIVVFGEVVPQSICVRYGLQIGGIMSKPVLALMWLMAPIAWPTAKVLDHALGEDHGTVYRKSGLKTLVTLHRSLGEVSQRLNQDEVTIISAVLDLKEKPVSSVMTPMEDVFTMSEDTVLDETMMDMILDAGYSRIPIHEPHNPTNFVGMLLVKILITYDPDDKMRVSEFPLATLPETRPETSCLDIVNFFQEGKSHMVLVSQYPGEDHGALGVVTLEDVIEELIGEEIIDESDVYIDVHKAIRRLQPAPRARPLRHHSLASDFARASSMHGPRVAAGDDDAESPSLTSSQQQQQQQQQATPVLDALGKSDRNNLSSSPKTTTLMMRRRSAGADGRMTRSTVPVRTNIDDMWEHLRHLGPSNPATNPKNTRLTTVKIKTGIPASRTSPERAIASDETPPLSSTRLGEALDDDDGNDDDEEAGETTLLLGAKTANGSNSSGSPRGGYGTRGGARDASTDAAGTDAASPTKEVQQTTLMLPVAVPTVTVDASNVRPEAADSRLEASGSYKGEKDTDLASASRSAGGSQKSSSSSHGDLHAREAVVETTPAAENAVQSSSENSPDHPGTFLALRDVLAATGGRPFVRSGSIMENVIETHGIRKVVLETTSSAEDEDEAGSSYPRRLLGDGADAADVQPVKESDPPAASAALPALTSAASGQQDGTHQTATEGSDAGGDGGDGTTGAGDGSGAAAKKKNRRKKRKGTR